MAVTARFRKRRLVDEEACGVGVTRLGFALSQHALQVELVGEALARYFRQYHLVVVVPDGAAHLVVVHVGLVLALAPAPRHLVGVEHAELTARVLPADEESVGGVCEQLQDELPQLDLPSAH